MTTFSQKVDNGQWVDGIEDDGDTLLKCRGCGKYFHPDHSCRHCQHTKSDSPIDEHTGLCQNCENEGA